MLGLGCQDRAVGVLILQGTHGMSGTDPGYWIGTIDKLGARLVQI